MENINQCILIGGGLSISEGIALGLKERIKNKFVILINYSYDTFDGTLLTFTDKIFYLPFSARIKEDQLKNPDIYESLRQLPLIIGNDSQKIEKNYILPNTIIVKQSGSYHREKSLINGFYVGGLSGIFALSLASYLMNYTGEIFLCGYDWSKGKTTKIEQNIHYYGEKIKHRGSGYVGYYNGHNPDNYFKRFLEPNLKIYNVSPNSNINTFEKINYEYMFRLLNNEEINQEELRNQIKIKLQS
jgi:hypothetical protein